MLLKKKTQKTKAFLPGEYFFIAKKKEKKNSNNTALLFPFLLSTVISHTWIAFPFIKSYRTKYISMTGLLCYHQDICIQEYKDLLRSQAWIWLRGSQLHSEVFKILLTTNLHKKRNVHIFKTVNILKFLERFGTCKVSKIIHDGCCAAVNENFALYLPVQSAEHTYQRNCKQSVAQTHQNSGHFKQTKP